MKEKELKSWEDFESQVQEVFSLVEALRQREESFSRVSVPLFRGHGDSNFPLQSSLDRIQPNFTLRGYHQLMRKISTIVNNCTDHNWNIPKYEPPTNQFWFVPQAYDFMVYLRHHGFPSPLLDWSRSPYIAAFFAFNSHKNSSSVAIFSFMEVLGQGKTGFGESSLITALGPNVRSHKRHYLQQSEYTICTKFFDGQIHFVKYDEVVVQNNLTQDLFVKYILPASEKKKVLSKLDLMNINEYSLFGTEEALMGTLRNREFPVKQKKKKVNPRAERFGQ